MGLCIHAAAVIWFEEVYSQGEYFQRAFTYRHYLAFAAVALNLAVYFLNRRRFKFTLLGMLLLGLLDVLSFTPDRFSVGMGFGSVRAGIQPLSLLFILGFYLLNRRSSKRLLSRLRTQMLPPPSPQKQAAYHHEQIARFKATYARYSDASLQEIVRRRAVVPDAHAAALQLLQERGLDVS
ncbi:hypothetical protein GCM10023186_30070 [Hymenobacter koreensis]|uniref:Uncharacterized protein n=1 Tax=Hymenobacter koreensis TaxID=1084523 RepID=A0ABP8J6P5_9BACT